MTLLSLGTRWGLFRHYWIIVKLVMTILATGLLLLHMQPIGHVADTAAKGSLSAAEMRDLRVQLLIYAALALAALLVATALAVYKPRGLTAYGWRKQQEERREAPQEP